MDIYLFFNKIVQQLDLGMIIDGPEEVVGGLTHKMFRVFTDKGRYIVKMLNPNIMKNSTSFDDCDKAEFYEELLKQNDIKAIYSCVFNNKKMQEIDPAG